MDELLPSKPSSEKDITVLNESYLSSRADDPQSVLAYWEVQLALEPSAKAGAPKGLVTAIESEKATAEDGSAALRFCRDQGLSNVAVLAATKKRWPESTRFREGRAG